MSRFFSSARLDDRPIVPISPRDYRDGPVTTDTKPGAQIPYRAPYWHGSSWPISADSFLRGRPGVGDAKDLRPARQLIR